LQHRENSTILCDTEKRLTEEEEEEEVMFFLEKVGNSNDVYVHIPIGTMRIFTDMMKNNNKIVPDDLIVHEGLNPADTSERIVPYLICTRINALRHAKKRNVCIWEVFSCTKGQESSLDKYVDLREVFVSSEIEKSCNQDGAHLSDEKESGYLAYVKSESVTRFVNQFDYVFKCERNNDLFDSKLFFKQDYSLRTAIFIQAKHTSQEKGNNNFNK